MKKAWAAPGIEYEVLSSTAFNNSQGEVVDGYYRDWQDCELYPIYAS